MSESLIAVITGNCKAWVKVAVVTLAAEADRQREIWNLRDEAQISLRETAGLNGSEPMRSVVIFTPSNGMSGYAEPVFIWRRQNRASQTVWMRGYPGVTGQACGESYPQEDGRPVIPPVMWSGCMKQMESSMERYSASMNQEVKLPISGSKVAVHGETGVRQDNSSNESPVMGGDAKCPDFCSASHLVRGYQSCPTSRGGHRT